MTSRILKIAFAGIWLILFIELVFNASIRQDALAFCRQYPALAPLILILAQMLLASFALPCSPLTILAGVLWGLDVGILYSISATILSSLWTFFIGRYVLRKRFEKRAQVGWWPNIVGLATRHDWKASMIAHANPVFPGSSMGYVFGMSKVPVSSFLFGALLGTLPLQIMMVGMGDLTGRILSDTTNFWVMFFLLIVIVGLIGYKIIVPRVLGGVDGR
jgi:uncharacterized membrane protein YdjX (TVP38/TMEM64 family)